MYSRIVMDAIVAKAAQSSDFTIRAVFVRNLIFFHQVITASERLLSEAASEADGELRNYFFNHLEEERDHAAWLARDLVHFDVDVKTVRLMPAAVKLAGIQYYLIKHAHPCCLLGYMAVLEGFPISAEALEALENAHGEEGLKTLRYHAKNDPQHRIELFAMIDKIARPEIIWSALQTVEILNDWNDYGDL